MSYIDLPKKEDDLVDAVDQMVAAGNLQRNLSWVEWFIAHHYLQGVRNFRVYSWREGNVGLSRENTLGEIEFKFEALLYHYRVELGRFIKLATDPVASRAGFGLEDVRKAGIGQGVLSTMTAECPMLQGKKMASRLYQSMIKYGMGTLVHSRVPGMTPGERTDVSVCPPWEFLPVPATIDTLEDLNGEIRRRPATVATMKAMGLNFQGEEKLNLIELPWGVTPWGEGPSEGQIGGFGGAASSDPKRKQRERDLGKVSEGGRKKKSAGTQKWGWIEEVWLYGPQGYICQYIVKVGDRIGKNETYYDVGKGYKEDQKLVPTINSARYVDTGSYYGRGFVMANISINYEVEKMLGNLFANVADHDNFPFIAVSANSGISRKEITKRERRKVVIYQPDEVTNHDPVIRVEPATSGDLPLKTSDFSIGVQEKYLGHTEMLSGGAPGRLDSTPALGFLYEASNVNVAAAIHSIGDAYSGLYGSMLQAAKREAAGDGFGKLRLRNLDLRMIGVVIDPQNGEVRLDENPIPDPWEVKLDIAERQMKSKEQEKQEGGLMLQSGILSPTHFRILNEQRGWGWPVLSTADYDAYRTMVYQIIVLFNDGQKPGQFLGSSFVDRVDIAVELLGAITNTIEFKVASPEVREEFVKLQRTYESMQAQWPAQLPPLEAFGRESLGQPGGMPSGGGAPGGMPQGMTG